MSPVSPGPTAIATAPRTGGAPEGETPLQSVRRAVAGVVRGKEEVILHALTTLVAGGHLLVEDLPGVGKSTLARTIAAAVGGEFSRIQFTADLLPADIVGVNAWRQRSDTFEFRPGPVFANFVLADEINRAPPRTQSALLEAMGEHQVSVDGQSHPLPTPFMVIATQNPEEHHGTYPLPESQRDRFLARVAMGYVAADVEAALLEAPPAPGTDVIAPVTTPEAIGEAQRAAAEVFVHPDLAAYAQRVVQSTREHAAIRLGVSTRGALGWVRAARARAHLAGRTQLGIDDLQDLATVCLAHRIVTGAGTEAGHDVAADRIREIVASVAVPR